MEIKEPNFFVIGAGKSGTTSIYRYLSEHPEIFMSPVKETNFFALEGKKIPAGKDPDEMYNFGDAVYTWKDYLRLFDHVQDHHKAVGEVSPMYLYDPEAAGKIFTRYPDAKIIAILRQPTERLYSRYMHLVRESREPSGGFEKVFDRNSIWWKRNDLVQEGMYFRHLKKYYDLFPEDQIQVFQYDDLVSSPESLMESIYSFLQVDSLFTPDVSKKLNPSGKIKSRSLDKLIGQKSILKNALASASPGFIKLLKNNSFVSDTISTMRSRNLEKAPLDRELRNKITEDIYAEEIRYLMDLTDMDLNHWLPSKQYKVCY